jgi:hypothetical protein
MNDPVNDLAMQIFVQMAAQYTVRHGLHESRAQAVSLVRESFMLAQAFLRECDARSPRASDSKS